MKITNQELLEAGDGLDALLSIKTADGKTPPAKISLQIGRLAKKVRKEFQETNETKLVLWRKYGEEKGTDIVVPPTIPNYLEFIKERDEFLKYEVERTFDLVVLPSDYQVIPIVFMTMPEGTVSLATEEPKKEDKPEEKKPG